MFARDGIGVWEIDEIWARGNRSQRWGKRIQASRMVNGGLRLRRIVGCSEHEKPF